MVNEAMPSLNFQTNSFMPVPMQREVVTEEKSCPLCVMPIQPEVRPRRCRLRRQTLAAIFFALSATLGLQAGPPFLTDDPEPVDFNHWEFYIFGQGDRDPNASAITAPAVEFNYGVAHNTQLHLVAPVANLSTAGAGWTSGYGDTEVGVKYRFLEETDWLPQVGVFPMAELATGSSARGLGNGRTY